MLISDAYCVVKTYELIKLHQLYQEARLEGKKWPVSGHQNEPGEDMSGWPVGGKRKAYEFETEILNKEHGVTDGARDITKKTRGSHFLACVMLQKRYSLMLVKKTPIYDT